MQQPGREGGRGEQRPAGKGLLCQGVWDVPRLPDGACAPLDGSGGTDVLHAKPPCGFGERPLPGWLNNGVLVLPRAGCCLAFPNPTGWAGSPVGLMWAGDAWGVLWDLSGQGAQGWAQSVTAGAQDAAGSWGWKEHLGGEKPGSSPFASPGHPSCHADIPNAAQEPHGCSGGLQRTRLCPEL